MYAVWELFRVSCSHTLQLITCTCVFANECIDSYLYNAFGDVARPVNASLSWAVHMSQLVHTRVYHESNLCNLSGGESHQPACLSTCLLACPSVYSSVCLSVCRSLRPLTISTKEFGSNWGSLSHERKVKVQCTMKPAEFMEAMKARLHFHPVELIGNWLPRTVYITYRTCIIILLPLLCCPLYLWFPGNEGITAATFLPNTMCLVHGKVASSHVDFWVRSPSSLLTESIAKCSNFVRNEWNASCDNPFPVWRVFKW